MNIFKIHGNILKRSLKFLILKIYIVVADKDSSWIIHVNFYGHF